MKTMKRAQLHFSNFYAIQLHTSHTSDKIVSKRSFKQSMKTAQSKNTTNEKQKQRLAFPTYDEEDILDWDAAIVTPPPRPSGTIRVRLIYKGRSKPFSIENFWEE